jgi:hypothetical protein
MKTKTHQINENHGWLYHHNRDNINKLIDQVAAGKVDVTAAVSQITEVDADAWYGKAQRFIEDHANKQYKAQLQQHLKKGRSKSTFRYNHDQFHRDFVDALGKKDEETVKGLMLSPGAH